MVNKRIETKKENKKFKIIVSYVFIILWIFICAKFDLFVWLADIFSMKHGTVGSINFWIILILALVPIILTSIYISTQHRIRYQGLNKIVTRLLIIGGISVISGYLIVVLRFLLSQ